MSPIETGSQLLLLIPEPVKAPATVRHAVNIVHSESQSKYSLRWLVAGLKTADVQTCMTTQTLAQMEMFWWCWYKKIMLRSPANDRILDSISKLIIQVTDALYWLQSMDANLEKNSPTSKHCFTFKELEKLLFIFLCSLVECLISS